MEGGDLPHERGPRLDRARPAPSRRGHVGAARLSGAIEQATGAERVYLQVYGETFRHWHVLLSARGAEIPLEHRHAAFHPHMSEYVDVAAAEAAGRRIAEAVAARA